MRDIESVTEGTCSWKIHFSVEGGVVSAVSFEGGCVGNLQALAILSEGRKASELIGLLEGIQCQNGTSCPDQFAKALRKAMRRKK